MYISRPSRPFLGQKKTESCQNKGRKNNPWHWTHPLSIPPRSQIYADARSIPGRAIFGLSSMNLSRPTLDHLDYLALLLWVLDQFIRLSGPSPGIQARRLRRLSIYSLQNPKHKF
jgi:hypothetical protein